MESYSFQSLSSKDRVTVPLGCDILASGRVCHEVEGQDCWDECIRFVDHKKHVIHVCCCRSPGRGGRKKHESLDGRYLAEHEDRMKPESLDGQDLAEHEDRTKPESLDDRDQASSICDHTTAEFLACSDRAVF